MGRYEIKNKSKGKREEICIVARKATHCMENSGMMVMQGGTVATPNAECRMIVSFGRSGVEKCKVQSEECRDTSDE